MSKPIQIWTLVLLGACGSVVEPDPLPGPPAVGCLVVAGLLVFESSSSIAPRSQQVEVRNQCDQQPTGDLVVRQIDVVGGAFAVDDLLQRTVPPGESVMLTVTYSPSSRGEEIGVVTLRSNDRRRPEVPIRLSGWTGGPALEVTPGSYDFGSPYIGCENGQPFTLRNVGDQPLVVTNVTMATSSPDAFAIDLAPIDNGELPFTIQPVDSGRRPTEVNVYADYLPLHTRPDVGFVTITSNSQFRPKFVVPVTGTGTSYASQIDRFDRPLRDQADILFTFDRSGSHLAIKEAIRDIETLTSALVTKGLDYRLAAVVQDSGCVIGPNPFVTDAFSATETADALTDMVDLAFENSPRGSGSERGFSLAEAALDPVNLGVGGCNEGLLRADATLSIVHVAYGPEQGVSGWSSYVSELRKLKSRRSEVRIHAVAGDYPGGCASATAGTGYYEATVATGGLFLSVCDLRWTGHHKLLAGDIEGRSTDYVLSEQPMPVGIEVWVDGIRMVSGWEYDISSNTIVFDPDSEPPRGSVVEIRYDVLPDCSG